MTGSATMQRDNPVAGERGAAWVARRFWPLLAAGLAVRLFFNARPDLVGDEAFYWDWTRHLSPGYFDHPPMVAWLMWISTRLLGDTESGVRLPAAIACAGALGVLFVIARQTVHELRAVGFVVLMWAVGPLLTVTATVCTPDAPATFFSVCALACAIHLVTERDADDRAAWTDCAGAWIAFGLFCGFAFLSKYTTVLVPGGVGLALLSSPAGRRQFARPWPYLSALIALLIFSPVIYWNATHRWASFAFQLHHGAGGGLTENVHGFVWVLLARLGGLGEFIGGQALVWTPILLGVCLYVAFINWRIYHRLSDLDRLLLWCGTLPLIFFGWAATRSHGEANWPAFAYFPLSLLVGRWLVARPSVLRVQWVRKGCEVALGFTIFIHLIATPSLQQWLLKRHVTIPHQATDLWGWREFGRQIAEQADGMPVVCNRHTDAGEAAFYMPGRPDVWCEGVGSRPTAFDYFDRGRPDYPHVPRLLFVGSHEQEFAATFGYTNIRRVKSVVMPGLGKHRTRPAFIISRDVPDAPLTSDKSQATTDK